MPLWGLAGEASGIIDARGQVGLVEGEKGRGGGAESSALGLAQVGARRS